MQNTPAQRKEQIPKKPRQRKSHDFPEAQGIWASGNTLELKDTPSYRIEIQFHKRWHRTLLPMAKIVASTFCHRVLLRRVVDHLPCSDICRTKCIPENTELSRKQICHKSGKEAFFVLVSVSQPVRFEGAKIAFF